MLTPVSNFPMGKPYREVASPCFGGKEPVFGGQCSLFSNKIVQQTFHKESEQQQGKRDRNGADREQYRVARVLGNPAQHDRTQPDAEVGGSRKRSIGYPFTVRAD